MNWKPINQYRDNHFPPNNNQASLAMFNEWAAGKNIARYAIAISGLDWERVLQTGRLVYRDMERDDPPELDHPVLFKSNGRVWLVYQPYAPVDKLRGPVTEWAALRGLEADIQDAEASWYYPGSTCLVVITKGAARE